MKWNKRTYWTLKEVITKNSNWKVNYDTGKVVETNLLGQELLSAGFRATDLPSTVTSTEADTLWTGNITGKYRDCYCVWKDNDDQLSEQDCYDFFVKYLHIFNDTWFKYKTMLDIYNSNLSSLMDSVQVVSENKFNDTPQNAQGTYNWSDDDHLTNVSRSTTSSDGNTKIARIKEIEKQLSDLYSEWSEEFRRIFIL